MDLGAESIKSRVKRTRGCVKVLEMRRTHVIIQGRGELSGQSSMDTLSGAVNTQGFVRSFYAPYTNLPSFIPHNSLHGSPQRLTSSEGGSVFRTINPSNHSAIIPECPTRPLPLALALPHQSAHPARSVSREQLYYSHWLDGTVSRDDSLLHFKHVIIITVLA